MATMLKLFAVFGSILCVVLTTGVVETPHPRFEYKYSFKGPYLAQKDGTVPFWEYEGSAIASEEMVRITPSLRSKKGSIWTKDKTNFEWWEIEMIFRVNGRGRVGADGLALWYTDKREKEGPVFGSTDKWVGLGIFFDSFDNDGRGNNPYIMAMTNDGTKVYDHQSDGINQQLAGCLRDFRNKPFAVRTKIQYYRNILTVLFHNGNTNNDNDYEMCLRAENVFLPQYGYYGISAATGGLAGMAKKIAWTSDDHDVLKFMTYSLHPPGTEPTPSGIADAEKEKFSKEYEQYKEKLDKQKEEFRKQHPDEAKKKQMEFDPEQEYESHQQRELRQIFQGQSQMFEMMKGVHRKLDEVIGREERVLSMLSAVQVGGAAGGGGGGGQGLPQGGVVGRHEVEAMLNNQREMVQASRDMKAYVVDIHQRTGNIIAAQKTGGGQVFEGHTVLNELKDGLNIVKRDLASVNAKTQANPCPPVQAVNCLTPVYFFIFMGVQLAVMIGYIMYKSNKEAQAKKFY